MVVRVLAGRYELVRFVGRGGMGEVWEGLDRVIERRVAVKLLAHEPGDESGTALFFREARAAGALHHPGVVTVHDLGKDDADGSLFLVMEFLRGRDLASMLRESGAPPVAVAVEWAAQTAAALARAHASNVVHRDLKPANLMLTDDGVVKILDFGIARFVESTNRSSKVMGTLAYMPPERFDEHPGDARSDLYSLGCVLHELLTGDVPFDASGPVAMMNAHLRRTPTRPGDLRPDVPAALDDLVLELLAKNPADRPADADDVHRRLRGLPARAVSAPERLAPPPAAAPPTEPNPRVPPLAGHAAGPATRLPTITAPVTPPPAGPDPHDSPKSQPAADERGDDDLETSGSTPASPGRRRFLWLAAGAASALTGGGAATALVLGRHTTAPEKPLVTRLWTYTTADRVTSSPTVANGVVYVGSWDHNVYALDAATGIEKRRYPTGRRVLSSPAVVGGVLYVGTGDGRLYALDAATGDQKWWYSTGYDVPTPAVANGMVYTSRWDRNVCALDAATGNEKWRYPTEHPVVSSPAVVDRVVYVGGGEVVFALDAATGTEKWRHTIESEVSTPAVANGVVYVAGRNGNVFALDAATGTEKWHHTTYGVSPPAVVDAVVYIGSLATAVYALDAATGTEKWRYPTRDLVEPSPAVVDGVVYICSNDRNVYALDAATGTEKWRYPTGDLVEWSPVVAGGVIYISDDHDVYALRDTT
ncbi:outer membrane protein assembly factor BamB family protein [Embleya sp. NPDC055664]